MKDHFQRLFSDQTKIEYWDSVYDQQDSSATFLKQRMSQTLMWLDGVYLSRTSKILDAGCGSGRLARELSERGYAVFGLDYSYGMLEKANSIGNRQGKRNVELLQGDVELMPYRDSSFDMIICLGVISYLKSEEKALNEFARVLKPGGIMIISIINKFRLVKQLDLPLFLRDRLRRVFRKSIGIHKQKTAEVNNDSNLTTYSIPSMRKSLQLRRLTVLDYITIPLEVLTLFGRDILPKNIAIKMAEFIDKLSNIPIVGSFGGMCIFKVKKEPL